MALLATFSMCYTYQYSMFNLYTTHVLYVRIIYFGAPLCMMGLCIIIYVNHHLSLSFIAVFRHKPVQFSPLEEDADRDDDPSPLDTEEGGEEEETELQRLSRRPWGVSKHYCPVVLRDQEVLWPGNPDHALRYRDRLYYFSSEEAKQTFEGHAAEYTSCVQKVSITQLLPLHSSLHTYVHIILTHAMCRYGCIGHCCVVLYVCMYVCTLVCCLCLVL